MISKFKTLYRRLVATYLYIYSTPSSLVQHLLRGFLKFTSTLINQLLLSCLLLCHCSGSASSLSCAHCVALLHSAILVRIIADCLSFNRAAVSLIHTWATIHLSRCDHGCLTAWDLNILFLGSISLLSNYIHHRVLQGFFIFAQSVLLPGVVHQCAVEVVSVHAGFKEIQTATIVGLLLEFKRTAVFHEFFKFVGLSTTQLFKGRFDFLFFNVIVLFIFRTSWQTLPR